MKIETLSDDAFFTFKNIAPMACEQSYYLINGELEYNGEPLEKVYSPILQINSDGSTSPAYLGSYPNMNSETAIKALDAAIKAYDNGNGCWPKMSVGDRIRAIQGFADNMIRRRTRVCELLQWEICKTTADAEKEFDRTIEYIRDTCKAMADMEHDNSRLMIKDGFIAQIRRSPLGVVLCMGPFNYPLNETFTTLIPALIMGNTVILKPAKFGVLLLEPLLECFAINFPKGVVNTIYGDGPTVVGPIMSSGKIDSLAFIGSSNVANILKKQHPVPNRLRCISGLQAKNLGIITISADIDNAVKECVAGSLGFNGQRCTALKHLLVDICCAREFKEKFCTAVDKLTVGLPWEKGTSITPLPETNKVESMLALIKDACDKGAKVINNGGVVKVGKNIMYPVVLDGVQDNMRIFHEEQFGPIVPISEYSTLDRPISIIRNSSYGQQVSIFSNSEGDTGRLIDECSSQVSRVNINSQCQRGPDSFPFTGRKDSAEATLSVTDALRAFSIRTLVAAKKTPENTNLVTRILEEGTSSFLTTDFLLV